MRTTAEMNCLMCGAKLQAESSRFCADCRGGGQTGTGSTDRPTFPTPAPFDPWATPEPRRRPSIARRLVAVAVGITVFLAVGAVVTRLTDPDRYLQGSTWEQGEIDHFRADLEKGAQDAGATLPTDMVDCIVAGVTGRYTPDQMRGMEMDRAEEIGAEFALTCLDSLGYAPPPTPI